MKTNYEAIAEEYYTLIGEKNTEGIKKYLHPDVEWIGPMATLKGKEAVLQATNNFVNAIRSLKVCAKFGAENQAMIVHESDIPGVAKDFRGAALINFRDGLISRIELFYDASRLMQKKEEIFS